MATSIPLTYIYMTIPPLEKTMATSIPLTYIYMTPPLPKNK
jgi:hypothetical protein